MRTKKYTRALHHLEIDAAILVVSIAIAYFMVRAGVFSELLTLTQGFEVIGAFVAGIFFTSMFTIAGASVAFVELANPSNVLSLSVAGALGAVCGDMLIFLFIRDTVVQDLRTVIKTSSYKKLTARFHGGIFRWAAPVIGAIVIASPLPDEVGLAMLGMSRVKPIYIIPVTFVMNFLGIWAIVSVANLLA